MVVRRSGSRAPEKDLGDLIKFRPIAGSTVNHLLTAAV